MWEQADIGAGDIIHNVEGVDPARRARLMELLDIDPAWRLNRVSDGQRRRVQICMGLLKPYQARARLNPCARECSTMKDTAFRSAWAF